MAWVGLGVGLVADHRCRAEDRLRGSSAENYEWELLLPAWARVLLRGVTARWLIVDKCIYIITYLQIHRPIDWGHPAQIIDKHHGHMRMAPLPPSDDKSHPEQRS